MARLSEPEQQEILRFLEADKPLPDKYRFLLFEDKREVELVWNGKTSEVCNIVLPFQVIEQVDGGLYLRERVAIFSHEERPFAGVDQRLSRLHAGPAQAGGQGGGHLRKRHDDHRGRNCRQEKGLRPFVGFQTSRIRWV
jgi:hypothetical protein